jgi:hypothetical protein
MSVLLLDRVSVKKTWDAVAARIERRPVFQVVPEDAMNTIESVIMVNEDEAWDRWPTNASEHRACRVQFWKNCLLEAVVDIAAEEGEKEPNVGLWAVYFHEYIAASLRGADAAAFDVDEDVADIRYTRASVSSVTAAQALRDAYATCAAGLEGYSVEWNS